MIHYLFVAYTLILAVRIIGSWVPDLAMQPWMLLIAKFTDPFLNLFRKIIPPIGGMLDLSPILAFLTLQFLEYLIRSILK
ncbi:MAG: YggT family protein [Rhabdochlamydiaceae bacterium]